MAADPDMSADADDIKLQSQVLVSRWQHGETSSAQDCVAEEVAVALVYNGISHVVMMTSPGDLADFALGFSITEGILEHPRELYDVDIQPHDSGIEVRLTVAAQRFAALKQQRRNLTGRTGCGLCGAETLAQAIRPIQPLDNVQPISDGAIQRAVRQLDNNQPQQLATGACHGAAWCDRNGDIVLIHEDIGRHNALDKLIGALKRTNRDLQDGFVLISSRASYEMVQKVTSVGIGSLVAVSAPTGLALRLAKDANLQLVGFARPQRHVTYSPEPATAVDQHTTPTADTE